jgi:glucosamine-6-phosphate deaminase
MNIQVYDTKAEMGEAAAVQAAASLRDALARQGTAHVIAATGASQFEFLEHLVAAPGIDWSRTVFFHLDEYVGLPDTHPASFRKYLRERIVDRVRPSAFHFIEGDAADPAAECGRMGELIARQPIDLAFVGIGENGHLAFNDPPADFETTAPYLVVDLDQDCRRQQLGEGWFPSLDDVPRRAISMSIQQVLLSREILCVVPDARKAQAVKDCLEGKVSPRHPASILQRHPRSTVFLDAPAAALLARTRR